MKSIEFLKTELKKLSVIFSTIQIRYEYKKSTNSHIIEVKPKSLFRDNEKYIDAEIDLESRFEELFVGEDIVFISESQLTKVNNPILTIGFETTQKVQKVMHYFEETLIKDYSNSLIGDINYALAA